MTREHKLALIIGFSLVLVVGVLISDHFSKARSAQVATEITAGGGPNFGAGTGGLHLVGAPPASSGTGMAMNPPTVLTPPSPLPGTSDPVVNVAFTPGGGGGAGGVLTMGERPGAVGDAARSVLGHDQTALAGTATTRVAPSEGSTGGVAGVRPLQPGSGTLAAQPESPIPSLGTPGNTAPAPVKTEAAKGETINGVQVPLSMMKRHDVREGESIYRIAQDAYGDGMLWSKLAECNKGKMGANGSVRAGVTLLLPPKEALLGKPLSTSVEAAPERAERMVAKAEPKEMRRGTAPAEGTGKAASPVKSESKQDPRAESKPEKPMTPPKVYTVLKGDSLSDIARKTLGSSKRWSEIVDANKDSLNDEDSLVVGSTLKLPVR